MNVSKTVVAAFFAVVVAQVLMFFAASYFKIPQAFNGEAESLMLEAGVDLTLVSRALGHSTISTTADLYSHISAAMFRGAANALDRHVEGGKA